MEEEVGKLNCDSSRDDLTLSRDPSACSAGQMGRIKTCLLWLSLCMVALVQQRAIAQPGFISIDCGSDAHYEDPVTNISWMPDARFIATGYNAGSVNISKVDYEENRQQLSSVRYFDDSRAKHCYVLPVALNATYLVRATFMYGDYDRKGTPPIFDLAIDSTFWTTIDLASDPHPPQSWYNREIAEILVPSSGSSLFVCLVRKAPTDNPFISSLELRPITNGAYAFVNQNNVILQTVRRINCGMLSSTSVVRYPDDQMDRFWVAQAQPSQNLEGTSIMTTERFAPKSIGYDQPPSLVLQSAWSTPFGFTFQWDIPTNFTKFYAALYFAEITKPNPFDTRIIIINFNGRLWGEPLYLTTFGNFVLVEKFGELTALKTANFSFFKAAGSTLDPIINALELYAVLGPPNVGTSPEDVSALSALRTQFNLQSWTGDPCLPVPWDWLSCSSDPPRVTAIKLSGAGISGAVPAQITQLGALTDLWLDNNNLTSIPDDFTPLANLQTLHLQNNRLIGNIPLSLTKLHHLTELFLENNLFNGTVPEELKNSSTFTVKIYGSPYLCPGGVGCGGKQGNHNDIIVEIIIGCVLAVVAAITILGVIIYYFRFRKFQVLNLRNHLSESSFEGSSYEMYSSQGSSPLPSRVSWPPKNVDELIQARNLSLHEVKLATRNFKIKIGEGRYGPVFYGQLSPDGHEVVVKHGYMSREGKLQFLKDVALLSRVRHKNVVSLVGYCDDIKQPMLVFEFMSKGTLRAHLYGNVSKVEPLSWTSRLDIALNAARGLDYLHSRCTPRMVHGDVSSNNILLDGNLVAHVADYAMSAKFTREVDDSKLSNPVTGTVGYVDPEYYRGQTFTPRSDVFSFGVVLLEMICGREPTRCPEQLYIIPWVKMNLQDGGIHAVIDPGLKGKYNVEAVWHVAELALLSTEMNSEGRPTMGQVVRGLAEAIEIESGSPVAIPVSGDLGLISVGCSSGSSRQ